MIYLDHNATTPLDPRVHSAMEPYLTSHFGNASSVHAAGRLARRAVEESREAVAQFTGAADVQEIVFTSGGTESNALALRSAMHNSEKKLIALSSVEHAAVAEPVRRLGSDGVERIEITVLPGGAIDLESAGAAAARHPACVSVMTANNEYGGLFPVAKLSAMAHARGALFHTDAIAAAGKMPLNASESEVDFLSISAHKIGGPKGVGALFVRNGVEVAPIFPGGGQESRRRGGTENVAGIAGFGEAARVASREWSQEAARLQALRDEFESRLAAAFPDAWVWGAATQRLPNTSAVCFPGFTGEAILIALDLDGVAVSVGSACSSGTLAPSPSILALGASPNEARSTVRFSFGRGNVAADIPAVLSSLRKALAAKVRA